MAAPGVILGMVLIVLLEASQGSSVARDMFPSFNWRSRRSDTVCTEYKEFKRVIGFLGTPRQVRIGGAEVTAEECKEACSTHKGNYCVGVNLFGGSVGPCKLIVSELADDTRSEHFDRICESGEDCYRLVPGKKIKNLGRSFVNKLIADENASPSASARSFCMRECNKYDVCVGFDVLSSTAGEYKRCLLNTLGQEDSNASAMFIRIC